MYPKCPKAVGSLTLSSMENNFTLNGQLWVSDLAVAVGHKTNFPLQYF